MTLNQRFATKAYARVDVQTRGAETDQHQLVMMMFEAVMDHAHGAIGAIQSGQTTQKVTHLHKAVRILQEGLRTSLDLDNGGELAQNLANLYDYCILRLTQANAQNDAAAVAEVVELIKPVADAWRQMRSGQAQTDRAAAPVNDSVAPTKSVVPPAVRRVSHAYGAGLSLQGA